MLIQKLRLQRGWSQEQLAELSGLSARTIQRIENGQSGSVESLKSLASVFEIEFTTLLPKPPTEPIDISGDWKTDSKELSMRATLSQNIQPHMPHQPHLLQDADDTLHKSQYCGKNNPMMQGVSMEEALAFKRVRSVRGFYYHAAQYVVIITGLSILNAVVSPHKIWVIYPALGWGIGLSVHAFSVFARPTVFGADWEKRQVEKILKRPL